MPPDTLLEVTGLRKYFPVREGPLRRTVAQIKAVDDVELTVRRGETVGLVGESGCGKTTTGRALLRLIEPTAGKVVYHASSDGSGNAAPRPVDVTAASPRRLKALRREMQIVFQDPYSSLDPRMTVGEIVSEPLRAHGIGNRRDRHEMVAELLAAVGMGADQMKRHPHEFSGGQRQRIGIARALVLKPKFIVADEPVSALDVSIQAQVVNLLQDLQEKFDLTYLFIAHDLSIVRHISNRVAVMYLGKVVELADAEALFSAPKHPYTEALMSAVPVADPDFVRTRILLQGDVPSPMAPPPGCPFHPRCGYAVEQCRTEKPALRSVGPHDVSCHRADELNLRGVGAD